MASESEHRHHGARPTRCCNCCSTSWWRATGTNNRWLCARCFAPDPDLSAIWHEPSAAELADAVREPRWSAAPEHDDYLLLRLRQVARLAARTAADLLGPRRPTTPRTSADLRTIDWHAIADATAIVAVAEELRGWALELDGAARAIARRAVGEVIGWPARETAAVLERALELLRAATNESAITALGPAWPAGHAPGSPTPIPLRVDSATEVLLPAHPHLVLLLHGVGASQLPARATRPPRAKQRKHIDDAAHSSNQLAGPQRGEALSTDAPSSSPLAKCHSCRGPRFFRLAAPWSPWTCATCHPPVAPPERFLWHVVGGTAGEARPARLEGREQAAEAAGAGGPHRINRDDVAEQAERTALTGEEQK
jgi:hypothetical protein